MEILGMEIEDIFKEMTDDELRKISNISAKILETRYNQKKEKDWLAVKDAIINYCKNHGSIYINLCGEDNLTIDSTNDFSSIGEIYFKEF